MNNVKEIALTEIRVSGLNPRKNINDAKLKELVESVKSKGILQPIIVRTMMDDNFEIVCGHRRYAAATIAGLKVIPCVVKEVNNAEALEIGVIENLQREDVNAMDEAAGISALMKAGKNDARAIASKLGKSESYVAGRMKLLKLPAEVQKAISAEEISPAHGLVIARLTDIGDQKKLLTAIKREKLSVRAAENTLDNYGQQLSYAPFDTKECAKCEHNGTKIKDFFDKDTNLKGRCMNPECMSKKTGEWVEQQKVEIVKQGGVVLSRKEAEKKFGDNFRYNGKEIRPSDKKELGKKHKEKCFICEKHCFVLTPSERGQQSESGIEEYCLNTRCFYGTQKAVADPEQQAEHNEQRNESKTLDRCTDVMRKTWQDFTTAQLIPHAVNVLTYKAIKDQITGYGADDTTIAKLWKKTDAELAKISQEGLKELITSQYSMEELAELSTGLKFDAVKDLILDDTYFTVCSKSELLKLAKTLGVKDLNESDKRAEMIAKVKAAVKPGFVPEDIKKYLKGFGK